MRRLLLALATLAALCGGAEAAASYPVLTPGAWQDYSGPADAFPGFTGKGSKFSQIGWAGHEWDMLTARKPWSISQPDPDTVRLELRQGDQAPFDIGAKTGSERDELAAVYDGMYQVPKGPGRIPIRTPVEVRYGLTIEPGPRNTASWLVLTQLHEDQVSGSPPISLCLAAGSDVLTINTAYTDAKGRSVNGPIWTDIAPLERGRRYQFVQWMYVDPSGAGRLIVFRDGIKLVDHTGPVGYVGQTNSFWKFGPYRHGPTPVTIAVRYDHMLLNWGK